MRQRKKTSVLIVNIFLLSCVLSRIHSDACNITSEHMLTRMWTPSLILYKKESDVTFSYDGRREEVVDYDVCDDATATDADVYWRPLTRQPRATFFCYGKSSQQRVGSGCGGRLVSCIKDEANGLRSLFKLMSDVNVFMCALPFAKENSFTIRVRLGDDVYMHIWWMLLMRRLDGCVASFELVVGR